MEDQFRRGYIKAHRSLLDHPRFKDGDWLKVWMAFLLLATHKGYRTVFDGKEIMLLPGQFITSRKSLSALTGVQESKVERTITTLKIEHQIEQVGGAKSRLISIKNWEKFQSGEQQVEQQVNNNRTTSEHKQECKEGEERKEEPLSTSSTRPRDPIWDSVVELFGFRPPHPKSEQKRIGAVVSFLRQKGGTAEEIKRRFENAKARWDGRAFGPEALTKHWDQLDSNEGEAPTTCSPPVTANARNARKAAAIFGPRRQYESGPEKYDRAAREAYEAAGDFQLNGDANGKDGSYGGQGRFAPTTIPGTNAASAGIPGGNYPTPNSRLPPDDRQATPGGG